MVMDVNLTLCKYDLRRVIYLFGVGQGYNK